MSEAQMQLGAPPESETKPKRPDFYSMHARKLLGMPEDWRWISIETISDVPERHSLIKGAIPDGVRFKSGPRKGQINYKRRHSEAQVVITDSQHRAFCEEWERETGSCSSCGGNGEGFRGAPCERCSGSGKATHDPEERR